MPKSLSLSQIHEDLLLGESVTVKLQSKTAANTLRIRLFRKHREYKEFGISNDDVSMAWISERNCAIYRLVRREPKTFTVISNEDIGTEDTNLCAAVGTDSQQLGASSRSLSAGQSGETEQQDAAIQVQGECQSAGLGAAEFRQDGYSPD